MPGGFGYEAPQYEPMIPERHQVSVEGREREDTTERLVPAAPQDAGQATGDQLYPSGSQGEICPARHKDQSGLQIEKVTLAICFLAEY